MLLCPCDCVNAEDPQRGGGSAAIYMCLCLCVYSICIYVCVYTVYICTYMKLKDHKSLPLI